uniref:Uncharacterized protein n=1 Tax=Arion vulgaris TaxID=1028688 RepID=A0A0B7BL85_9EUPU
MWSSYDLQQQQPLPQMFLCVTITILFLMLGHSFIILLLGLVLGATPWSFN